MTIFFALKEKWSSRYVALGEKCRRGARDSAERLDETNKHHYFFNSIGTTKNFL